MHVPRQQTPEQVLFIRAVARAQQGRRQRHNLPLAALVEQLGPDVALLDHKGPGAHMLAGPHHQPIRPGEILRQASTCADNGVGG